MFVGYVWVGAKGCFLGLCIVHGPHDGLKDIGRNRIPRPEPRDEHKLSIQLGLELRFLVIPLLAILHGRLDIDTQKLLVDATGEARAGAEVPVPDAGRTDVVDGLPLVEDIEDVETVRLNILGTLHLLGRTEIVGRAESEGLDSPAGLEAEVGATVRNMADSVGENRNRIPGHADSRGVDGLDGAIVPPGGRVGVEADAEGTIVGSVAGCNGPMEHGLEDVMSARIGDVDGLDASDGHFAWREGGTKRRTLVCDFCSSTNPFSSKRIRPVWAD